jgi:hypothetical protein
MRTPLSSFGRGRRGNRSSTQEDPAHQRQRSNTSRHCQRELDNGRGIRHALSTLQIEIAAVCLDPTTTLDSISIYAPNVLVANAGATGLANTILPRIRKLNLQTRSVAVLDCIDHSDLLRAASLWYKRGNQCSVGVSVGFSRRLKKHSVFSRSTNRFSRFLYSSVSWLVISRQLSSEKTRVRENVRKRLTCY